MLIGISILFAVVVGIGGSQLFKETVPAETYFNESIEGLDIGAPVKYRGVPIGKVRTITFIGDKYPESQNSPQAGRYVLVGMELDKATMDSFVPEDGELEVQMQQAVKNGLRIRLNTKGLTGVAYLELNFFDTFSNKPLPINWKPKDLYFPSAPSTLSRIEGALDAVGGVMRQLEQVDFRSFAKSIDDLMKTLDRALSEANVKDIGQLVVQTLAETRDTMARINALVHDPHVDSILPDASSAMSSAKHILQGSEKNVVETMDNINVASAKLVKVIDSLDKLVSNPALAESAEVLPETLDNVRKASDDIRRSAGRISRILKNLNNLITSQSSDIDAIVEETKELVKNFNQLLGDIEQNPSRLFFGAPPNRIQLEKKE